MSSSSPTKVKYFHEESSQLIVFTPKISSDSSVINFSDMSYRNMSYHSNITRGKNILLRQQRWIPIPECLLDNKLMKASEENRDLMNREFEMAVSKTDVTKKICRWLSCDKVWWVRIGLGPATSWAARVGICWHRETSETCQLGNQKNLRRQPGNPEPESVRVPTETVDTRNTVWRQSKFGSSSAARQDQWREEKEGLV